MGKFYETPKLRVFTWRGDDIVTGSNGEGFARDFNDWAEGNPFGEVNTNDSTF